MNRLLIVVDASPWGSSLATAAWRFARAAITAGARVTVFFNGDGIYNAVVGDASDQGLESPQQRWRKLAASEGARLWICPAAAARRLPEQTLQQLSPTFTVTGLARLLEEMSASDRVVNF